MKRQLISSITRIHFDALKTFSKSLALLLLSFCLLTVICAIPGLGKTSIRPGIAYYNSGQYSRAREFFERVLEGEPDSWKAHYVLGNTLMRMNEIQDAKSQYEQCLKTAPDPKIAKGCGQMIAYINHITGTKLYESHSEPTIKSLTSSASSGAALEFKDRINIVSPQFDHPQVSEGTVNTVRRVLASLPSNIYEILNSGGATVNISPNITDRWPDMLKGKLDDEGLHLAQDAARCYGKDVYIYERQLIPGTTRLTDIAFDAESVRNVLLHELGHAVDVCSNYFTKTPAVLDLYKADVDAMSEDERHRLWYYTKPGYTGCKEAFAETFAGLLGAQGKDTEDVRNNYPRLKAWIKDRLKL